MYYSDEIIEEVRARNDIVDVIGTYVGLRQRGSSYTACCPFHHEKTPSFHVSRDKQMYHCFGCGAGGNVFTFIMEYENYSFPEAVKYLAERAGIQLPEREMSENEKRSENKKVQLREVNKSAAAYFHYLLTKSKRGALAYKYFKERGLTDETITKFALGYSDIYSDDLYKYLKSKGYKDELMKDAGLVEFDAKRGPHDRFWNRVMVPITDINGKVVAFGGRVMGDSKPKYLNTKETDIFDKSHLLFAMNMARRSKRRGIILCEGYMDVIAMHQAGFDNAVASLGTAFTVGQANIIKRYTNEVYLAYDSDDAGVRAAIKAIGILREMDMTSRVINMKPYKDPDEFIKNLGRDEYEKRINEALSGPMFEVAVLSESYNMNDPEEKTEFMREAAKKLAAIEDKASRSNYIETVSNKYFLDRDNFKSMVTSYGIAGMAERRNYIEEDEKRREYNRKKEDGRKEEEKLLLTWLANKPVLFDKLEGIISEKDFTEGDYEAVAKKLFQQYKETKKVNPASIVNMSDDLEKQRLVAEMLQTELQFETTDEETEQAINDVVKKIKLENIKREMAENKDINRFQELINMKNQILKMHISL